MLLMFWELSTKKKENHWELKLPKNKNWARNLVSEKNRLEVEEPFKSKSIPKQKLAKFAQIRKTLANFENFANFTRNEATCVSL